MGDQRKEHIDTKGTKQKNRPKQLQTYNLPTNDWKLSTAEIKEEIYYSLTSLFTDKHILNESKTRR